VVCIALDDCMSEGVPVRYYIVWRDIVTYILSRYELRGPTRVLLR
jgi:hypothetical protein